MPSSKFKLLNWLNYHKEFGIMDMVIENNRMHCLNLLFNNWIL